MPDDALGKLARVLLGPAVPQPDGAALGAARRQGAQYPAPELVIAQLHDGCKRHDGARNAVAEGDDDFTAIHLKVRGGCCAVCCALCAVCAVLWCCVTLTRATLEILTQNTQGGSCLRPDLEE